MIFSLCFVMVLVMSGTSGFLEQLEKPEVREIKARLEEEKAKRLLLQNDVEMLMLKVAQLERKNDDGYSAKSADLAVQQQVTEISFSARLTTTTAINKHHVITFDQVEHNIGNAYSLNTGVFRAPLGGTYMFSLAALSSGKGDNFHLSIMKNGTEIGRVFSGSDVAAWGVQGSVTVVTALNQNDEVYVWEFDSTSNLYVQQQVTEIAFSARLTTTTTIDKHHVITFDQVEHNIGNAYSLNTGVFRAPFGGTYMFSLAALSSGKGDNFHLSIMKNGTEIGKVFSGSDVAAWGVQGSVTVVTALNQNDEVYVWEFDSTSNLY